MYTQEIFIVCVNWLKTLHTSEGLKFPLVHKTMQKTEMKVFIMAYCSDPSFSRNSMRLNEMSSVSVSQKYVRSHNSFL